MREKIPEHALILNHMFVDGNKRTAVEMIKSFMNKAEIPINKKDTDLMNIATQVAINQISDITIIANKIIE